MRNWLIIVVLLVSANVLSGQTAAADDLREQALALLTDAAREMREMRVSENRVRAQAQLASLFWAHDEKQARALFDDAAASCRNLLEQIGKDEEDENPYSYPNYGATLQTRDHLIRLWAQRDGAAALSFARASRSLVTPFQSQNYGQENQEMALEAFIAEQLVRQDPKLALKTARDSLAQGLTGQHAALLNHLKTVDRAAANELARLMRDKALAAGLLQQNGVSHTVLALLQFTHESLQENSGNAALNAGEIRALAEGLVKTAQSAHTRFRPNQYNQEFYNAQSLLANLLNWKELEKYAPGRAAELKQTLATAEQTANQNNPWQEYINYIQERPLEEALAKIAEAPPEYRDNLYQQASWRAASQGNYEQARQIINENVKNPVQRANYLRSLEQQAINQAVGKGDITAARVAIAQLRTRYERAQMLMQLAGRVAGQEKKDKDLARELWDEAAAQLPPRVPNQMYLHLYFSVIGYYAREDPARAFAWLETLAEQFNDLCAGAEKVNGFLIQAYQKGELTANGALGGYAAQLASAYATLARQDFGRVKTALTKIQRPEARIMAALAVGQNVLESNNSGLRTTISLPVQGRGFIID